MTDDNKLSIFERHNIIVEELWVNNIKIPGVYLDNFVYGVDYVILSFYFETHVEDFLSKRGCGFVDFQVQVDPMSPYYKFIIDFFKTGEDEETIHTIEGKLSSRSQTFDDLNKKIYASIFSKNGNVKNSIIKALKEKCK